MWFALATVPVFVWRYHGGVDSQARFGTLKNEAKTYVHRKRVQICVLVFVSSALGFVKTKVEALLQNGVEDAVIEEPGSSGSK